MPGSSFTSFNNSKGKCGGGDCQGDFIYTLYTAMYFKRRANLPQYYFVLKKRFMKFLTDKYVDNIK